MWMLPSHKKYDKLIMILLILRSEFRFPTLAANPLWPTSQKFRSEMHLMANHRIVSEFLKNFDQNSSLNIHSGRMTEMYGSDGRRWEKCLNTLLKARTATKKKCRLTLKIGQMTCPKWFWTVQIILIGTKSFWSGPNHCFRVQIRFFWTNFNLDIFKMI